LFGLVVWFTSSVVGVGQTDRVDATQLLFDLVAQKCRFVVVGSTARSLAGDRSVPADLDLVLADDPQVVDRVMAVLATAGGRLAAAVSGLRLDAPRTAGHDLWRVETAHGPVDIIIRFPDGSGFEQFAPTAVNAEVPGVGAVLINVGGGS